MTKTRGAASTTRRMKAGRGTSPLKLANVDLEKWHVYFMAGISGIVAAHRRIPNPDLVARMAARIADRALVELQTRRQ